jgi:hypothetical protein
VRLRHERQPARTEARHRPNFRYDRQLGALNTVPAPSEVKAMLEKEKDSGRVTGRDEPKHDNPEVKPKSE